MTASEKILQKSLAASGLDSAQWNQVQAALRDRAFFSSKVESANFLFEARRIGAEAAAGNLSQSDARLGLRQALMREGAAPATWEQMTGGSLRDLMSKRRLDMVINMNVGMARGWRRRLDGLTQGALEAFPGQELLRVAHRVVPREWTARWRNAGGAFYGGRMIALKTDPIWAAISRFGHPYPPFDFNSGMGVQAVSRADCAALGVPVPALGAQAAAEAAQAAERAGAGFNDGLEAAVPFTGPKSPEWKFLEDNFGDQITRKEGKVMWRGEVLRNALLAPPGGAGAIVRLGKAQAAMLAKAPPDIRAALEGKNLSVLKEFLAHLHDGGHFGDERADDPRNIKLSLLDFDLLAALWRNPDTVEAGKWKDSAVLKLETFDGHTLVLALAEIRGGLRPSTFYKRRNDSEK